MTTEVNDTLEQDVISGTGPYAFSFRIFSESDLTVTALAPGDVDPVTLTLNSNYTVTGVNAVAGGSITLINSTETTYAGYTIDIRSNVPRSQPTSIKNQGSFLPVLHETAFDRLSRQIQDLYRQVRQAFRYPDNVDLDAVMTDRSSWLNKYVYVNPDGEFEPASSIGSTALTQSLIGTTLYPRTAAEIAASVTPTNYSYPEGHVYRYGTNTTPGATDMTTAFQNAALSSLNPYAPADTYLVTGSIPLRANQHWRFDGAAFTLTGTTVQVFTASVVNDWSIRGAWSVTGDNGAAGATSGSAAALKIVDCMRFHVDAPIAKNIKGWGILVQPGSNTSSRAEHGLIVAPQAYACYRGIEVQAGTGAEYITIKSPNISRCNIGAYLAAGNVNLFGGSITDNTDNLKIGNGSNHAHGIISGVNLNHATQYLVHCDNVTNGQSFVGCHLYANDASGAGAIFLDQCKGITFDGGHLDCWAYNYKGAASGLNVIRNMYCPGAYGVKRKDGSNNGHDELIFRDCFGPGIIATSGDALDAAGTCMNDPAYIYVHVKRASTSTQSLTSGVAADLTWSTEVSDRRGVHTLASGVTTIPSTATGVNYQGGIYRICGSLVFSGTSMSTTASVVELKVGSTAYRLFAPTISSTTRLVIPISCDVTLAAGDAIKFTATITGTTPVHGDSTYESALTIQKL